MPIDIRSIYISQLKDPRVYDELDGDSVIPLITLRPQGFHDDET